MWNALWTIRHFPPSPQKGDLMIKLRGADRRDRALNCWQSPRLTTGRKWHHFVGFFAKYKHPPLTRAHTLVLLMPNLVPSKYSHFKVARSCQVKAWDLEALVAPEQKWIRRNCAVTQDVSFKHNGSVIASSFILHIKLCSSLLTELLKACCRENSADNPARTFK